VENLNYFNVNLMWLDFCKMLKNYNADKMKRYCGGKKNEWDNIALRKSADNGKTWLPVLLENEGRYFCSIFLKDNHTLALITTRNYPDGRSEIFLKEGRIYSRSM
jgi:hypothetical protein